MNSFVKAAGSAMLAFCMANVHWLLLAVLMIGVVFFTITQIQSCNSLNNEKKMEQLDDRINQEKGKIEILQEERKNEKTNVNQAEQQSAAAGNNLNAVLNTDSGSRSASRQRAVREWCKDHQSDSKCRSEK